MAEPVLNRADYAKSFLINQYCGSPYLNIVLEILANEKTEIAQQICNVIVQRNLADAEGAQLDALGKIVGLPRPAFDASVDNLFTFDNVSGDGAGFGTIGGSSGGFFVSLEPLKGGLVDDETYRLRIQAKIIRNTTNSSLADMIKYSELIFNANATIVEGNGFVQLTVGRQVRPLELAFIQDTFPRAAGVQLDLISYVIGPNPFGFSGNLQNVGFRNLADAQTGSGFASLA